MARSWLYIAFAISGALLILGAYAIIMAQAELASGKRETSMVGKVVCLPHKKPWFGIFGGPETKECRIGLHGEGGKYYALNFLGSRDLELLANSEDAKHLIKVSGSIRIPAPYPELDRYDVVGVIDVASAFAYPPTTTLYLFKPSPDAPELDTLHYGSLYIRVRDIVGGLDPLTFEQAHYTLGKAGVFHYNGQRH